MNRTLTKKPMRMTTLRISDRDKELYVSTAALEGISQAEFLRLAIRERAKRILRSSSNDEHPAA